MQLYLIRHAVLAGDSHQHYTPPVQGCLNARGIRQAAALATALDGVPFHAVYASPLGRAIQTAQSLAEPRGLAVEVLEWLIEWRPATVLEGCNKAQYEEMMSSAAALRPEQSWKTRAGEGALEMAQRVIIGFLRLMDTLGVHAGHGGYLLDEPEDGRRVALVGHGGSLGCLAAFLLGVPIRPYAPIHMAETGVAVFDFVRRVDVWYPSLRIPAPYAEIVEECDTPYGRT